MNGAKEFEDLRIWRDARALVNDIYRATGNGTPAGKDWGFKDQIQRAGVSVMNNIAEGFERESKADFARLLDVARGSAGEVRSMLYVAEDLGYLSSSEASKRRDSSRGISRGIAALAAHLRKE